jgi:hypothetical protein
MTTRPLKRIHLPAFVADVRLHLAVDPQAHQCNADELTSQYNTVLDATLNSHSLLKSAIPKGVTRKDWYNDAIHEERKKRRRLERKYKKSNLEIHRQMLKEQNDAVVKLINQRKAEFYNGKLNDADNKDMFRILNSLLNASPTGPLPTAISDQVLAELFSWFFQEKINKIQRQLEADSSGVLLPQTAASTTPLCTAFVEFKLVTPETVTKIIKTSPPKSCALDPIPTTLLQNEELPLTHYHKYRE